MADFVVHFATAHLPGQALRDDRLRAVFYVGVCLPDVWYKGTLYLAGASNWACETTHSPLGLLPFCYATAMLFQEDWRRRAFLALLGGSYLHLLVDVAKDFMGSGVLLWAFPFTMDLAELGWYRPEETILLMAPAFALIGAVEFVAWRLRSRAAGRPRTPAGSPP